MPALKRTPYRFGLVAAATLLVVAAALLARPGGGGEPSYISNNKINFAEAAAYWKARIAAVGPEKARAEFLKTGNSLKDQGLPHVLAHVFGGALYERLGPPGFSYCGNEFSGGCLHEIVGRSISEFGISAANTFARSCGSRDCFHALGHGMLSYFGYDFEGLKKTLSVCDGFSFASAVKRSDCRIGTFMEYNQREMLAGDTGEHWNPRQFSESLRFDPCMRLDEKYRSECVFQLPYWWANASSASEDRDAKYVRMGGYCRNLKDDALIEACFEGIGFIAPWWADFNEAMTTRLCTDAGSADNELNVCLTMASEIFHDEHKQASDEFLSRFDPGKDPIGSWMNYIPKDD